MSDSLFDSARKSMDDDGREKRELETPRWKDGTPKDASPRDADGHELDLARAAVDFRYYSANRELVTAERSRLQRERAEQAATDAEASRFKAVRERHEMQRKAEVDRVAAETAKREQAEADEVTRRWER